VRITTLLTDLPSITADLMIVAAVGQLGPPAIIPNEGS